ncbi:MAG: hypothetical protein AAF989_02685, partial [Planctomycetota bacterium]
MRKLRSDTNASQRNQRVSLADVFPTACYLFNRKLPGCGVARFRGGASAPIHQLRRFSVAP